jgi:hypothetical protein
MKSPYGLALPCTYEVHQLSTGPSAIVYDARGMAIDTHLFEEQAADIVRAVNAHAELVDALKSLLREAGTSGDFHYEARSKAHAVLKKLEGRQ